MPSVQQLLLVDVSLLLVLLGCTALLLRRALEQGRAKKALEGSVSQTKVAVNPFVQGRAAAAMTYAEVASVFAPQHAVPEVRRPLWSDTMPVMEDAWIGDAVAPPAPVTFAEEFVFALEAPAAEAVPVVEDAEPTAHLPREQVGILFLDDDQDVSQLRLAEVTEFAPRAVRDAAPAVQFEDAVLADPIDGVPFLPGEEVVPCACGAAYRPDTAEWLRESAEGKCVLCHRALGSSTREMPGDLLAESA